MATFAYHPLVIALVGYVCIPTGWVNFLVGYALGALLVIFVKPAAKTATKAMAMSYELQE